MGTVVREAEAPSPVPAAKLFKVFLLESHKYIPKIVPQFIKNIEILQGDGGAGSIKKTIFADGMEVKYMKHTVDFVDEKNLIFKYSTIEGEPWMNGLEKVTYESQIVPSSDGGSIGKYVTKYHAKGDATLDIDTINKGEENGIKMFKEIEAYILANPDV